ncbi:hypothetical protein FE241_25470 [Raoultella terrigena]|nr:hypothetical protein [Raoultella terrigena]NWK90613.1 hypothetical protein [Raoultella terrigena]ROS20911.1 hypothetical protein EDF79_3465 [Raoultella terrigena]
MRNNRSQQRRINTVSHSSVNDPDKPARHPAKDDPRERGEIPRKRDDSEDRQKDPWQPAPDRR